MIIIDTLYAVVCCDGQHLCKRKCINTKDDKDKDCILNDVVKYNTQTLHNKYHCMHHIIPTNNAQSGIFFFKFRTVVKMFTTQARHSIQTVMMIEFQMHVITVKTMVT